MTLAKIQATQKLYQSLTGVKHVHLKGSTDMITSVAIPGALMVVGTGYLVSAMYKLATGTGKKEGF